MSVAEFFAVPVLGFIFACIFLTSYKLYTNSRALKAQQQVDAAKKSQ